MVILKDTPI